MFIIIIVFFCAVIYVRISFVVVRSNEFSGCDTNFAVNRCVSLVTAVVVISGIFSNYSPYAFIRKSGNYNFVSILTLTVSNCNAFAVNGRVFGNSPVAVNVSRIKSTCNGYVTVN